MAARPLHLIWVLDTSGSMADDGKIQALNNAIREAIPHLREVGASNPHAQLTVQVATFSTGARWHVEDPEPIETFEWRDVEADGYTDAGAGLALVAGALRSPPMHRRAFPPVLVLVSDGQPTDDFDEGLSALLGEPWGARSVRTAIAIGRDADATVLGRFSSDPSSPVVAANNPEQLARMIRFASTTAARSASIGIAQKTLGGGVPVPTLSDGDASW